MPTDDKTPSGSHGSDISFDLHGRFLPEDMVNGRLIAAARTLLAWDQSELAHRAGIRRHTLAALEGDVRRSQARVREAVLAVLSSAGIRFVKVSEAAGVVHFANAPASTMNPGRSGLDEPGAASQGQDAD